MKKYILLFTSAALLLVGCAKEQIVDLQEGELTNVTFTANLDNGVATKASADNDGAGTNVNRCIMEIYYGDTFYKRLVQPVSDKVATFANISVVAGKEYKILFWADCGNGDKTDKYYTTNGPDSLKAVTVNGTAFKGALEAGENDKLDAFFGAKDCKVTQTEGNFNITLHRPFAQLNVITTDVAANKAVISEGLLPDKVAVKYKAANIINVATGEVSGNVDYEYVASVYGKHETWDNVKSSGELTLSMDYIFAEAEKRVIDVTFKTKNGDNVVLTHNLTNLPYQRNYRTNVKGDLLTVGGTWKATIDAGWTTPDYDIPFYVASSIQDAQEYIGTSSEQVKSKAVDLSKAAISQDDVNSDGTIHFILKTTSPKDLVNFTLPAIPETIENCEGWTIEYEPQYPTENVGVNAPEGTKVKILAPTSHVNVTGTSYTEITALTGDNTLVIPQGVTVASLIIQKGAVEIHGAVSALEVSPEEYSDGSKAKVVFRACEGLSATVFAKIYSETEPVCNYIDPMYTYECVDGKYNIYKLPVVAMIGEAEYKSLSDAFNAVPTDAAAAATVITVVADANETFKTRGAELKKDQKVILDLNGHKLVGTSMESGYTQYIYVENGGELTVKDSQTGGAIEYHDGYIENLTSGSGTGGSAITCHGCMTLESGTIENKTPDTMTDDLEGAIDMYTNAWGQAYSPADIVLNINGGVVKSNNANTIRLTSFSAQSYTTSVTVNMNGGEVYGRDGFFIQGVSESYLNTNTLNLNSGKVYGTQAVRVMAWQNHENASELKPVTIRIREGVDIQNNYFAQSTKQYWNKGICIDNLSGTYEQLLSYVNIIDAAVCKIGETYYPTLEAAVDAAAPLAQIHLVDNCAEKVTVAKNVELFADGFEFSGKLIPASGFYTFDKNDISNLGDFSSFYPTGMDYITLAYPSAEVHNIDCSGETPVVFAQKELETAYSFNAFDTQNTREDTGLTDMFLMTKVLGEPDFSKLNNFDFDAFGQAFEELTEPQKKRVNEIISTMLPYLSWIADFEVHFNKDVAEGSLGVSGYYGSYAEAEGSGLGMDIDAPKEIKVGDTYRMLYEYASFKIPYAGICLAVRTFDCGAYRIANDVAGTEMTVDLCLYNSNESSDVKKIVVGTYSYTFPEQQTE